MTNLSSMDVKVGPANQQPQYAPLDFAPMPRNVDLKILFVYPNVRFDGYTIRKSVKPHLGLAGLSSCCKKISAKTSLCDLTTVPAKRWNDLFRARLKKDQPDLVAITVTSMQWPYVIQLVEICKQFGIPHVVGGPHPTDNPESTIEVADVLVIGEGEGAMLDIVRAVASGQPLTGIPNTWVRTEAGHIVQTDCRRLIEDLDELPFPDWLMFHPIHYQLELYFDKVAGAKYLPASIQATIEGSRGCPFQCTYCSSAGRMKAYRGKGTWRREKSPRRLIEELKAFRAAYGVLDHVHWVDEIFMTGMKRLAEFCEMYKREIHVPFIIKERPENVTEAKVKMLADAGLRMIAIGLESADERLRREVLNRKISNDALKRAFQLPRKYGIRTYCFTMIGLPGQGIDSMLLTWKFLREVKPDTAQFTVYCPMRGTVLYDECLKRGIYDPKHDTDPWDLSPKIKHDLLDDQTIVRYRRLLSDYAAERGLWPVLAFHLGRRWDWAYRLVLGSRGRWRQNKEAGLAGIRNVMDVIVHEVRQVLRTRKEISL